MSKTSKVLVFGSGLVEKGGLFKTMPRKLTGGEIIVNRKISYNSPSPGGRELEGGGIHPHLNPLPSRERNFIQNYVEGYKKEVNI